MSHAIEENIVMHITAEAHYLPERSHSENSRFLWSYEITIENKSESMVQLLNRLWRITDMTGHVEEVRGPGVIGLQPVIKAGKTFSYTSFCQLMTPQGTMEGHYEMVAIETEIRFAVPVPKFILSSPASNTFYRSKLH